VWALKKRLRVRKGVSTTIAQRKYQKICQNTRRESREDSLGRQRNHSPAPARKADKYIEKGLPARDGRGKEKKKAFATGKRRPLLKNGPWETVRNRTERGHDVSIPGDSRRKGNLNKDRCFGRKREGGALARERGNRSPVFTEQPSENRRQESQPYRSRGGLRNR